MPTSDHEHSLTYTVRELVSQATKRHFQVHSKTTWNGGMIQGINTFLKLSPYARKPLARQKQCYITLQAHRSE